VGGTGLKTIPSPFWAMPPLCWSMIPLSIWSSIKTAKCHGAAQPRLRTRNHQSIPSHFVILVTHRASGNGAVQYQLCSCAADVTTNAGTRELPLLVSAFHGLTSPILCGERLPSHLMSSSPRDLAAISCSRLLPFTPHQSTQGLGYLSPVLPRQIFFAAALQTEPDHCTLGPRSISSAAFLI